jgi:hypothetical protein
MLKNRVTTTPAPEVKNEDELIINEPDESDRECSDEEDFDLLIGFDPQKATDKLFSLNNSIRVTIR